MSDTTMMMLRRTKEGRMTVTAKLLAEWVYEGPAPMIVDVRTEGEFGAGHILESECFPISRPRDLVQQLPGDGLVVLVCDDGGLSAEAAHRLRLCGFPRVTSLEGGLAAWRREGFSLTR